MDYVLKMLVGRVYTVLLHMARLGCIVCSHSARMGPAGCEKMCAKKFTEVLDLLTRLVYNSQYDNKTMWNMLIG